MFCSAFWRPSPTNSPQNVPKTLPLKNTKSIIFMLLLPPIIAFLILEALSTDLAAKSKILKNVPYEALKGPLSAL